MSKRHHHRVVTMGTAGPKEEPWGRNWIDHRHSRSEALRRSCECCGDCGCELDKGDAVHSPRCKA